jgi:hypothetical protein
MLPFNKWLFGEKYKHTCAYTVIGRTRREVVFQKPFSTIKGYVHLGRCLCGEKSAWVETSKGPVFCIKPEWAALKIKELGEIK